MSKIKITRIIARLNVGGPAIHVVNLVAALDPARFENHLIVGQPGPHEGNMDYLARRKGITPLIISELGREISPARDVLTVLKLVRILRHQRPHIVETHTAKAGTVGRVAARLAGVPVIIHVFHGHVFHSYFGPAKTRLFIGIERALARLTDRIITISPAQHRDIAQTYRIASPEKVLMIPLGLDLQPFAMAKQTRLGHFRTALRIPDSAPLVGFVGRLTSVKNPSLFVEAASRIARQISQACFVFVGDGELRPDLEQQVAALGLAQQVVFAGWQDNMLAVYADLDMLVLTSSNEGTPVTIIEALAASVPVVATAVGGVSDVVIDQKTGLLVPSGDADALAQAIARLLRDPDLRRRMGRAGRERVERHFGVERMVRATEALYEELVREKMGLEWGEGAAG